MKRCTWRLVVMLTCGLVGARADEPKPPELTPAQQKRHAEAVALSKAGGELFENGQPAAAAAKLLKALEISRELYPASIYPNGHADLARCVSDLGVIYEATGDLSTALKHHQEALAMRKKLYPAARFADGHADLVNSLSGIGSLLVTMGRSDQAKTHLEEALAMSRTLFPKAKHPRGDVNIVVSLTQLANALQSMGRDEKALPHYEEALAMIRALYPPTEFPGGHPYLALGLNNMGYVRQGMGQLELAVMWYEQALAMYRQLFPEKQYPDGHPFLAQSLNNLGYALSDMGQLEKALTYYDQALTMRRKLYPAATYAARHPDLIQSLTSKGYVLKAMGRLDEALQLHEQALTMARKLYPEDRFPAGHPDVTTSIINLSAVLQSLGQSDKALPYVEQALAMFRKRFPPARYPDGHPDLATGISNLANVLHNLGRLDAAVTQHKQALAMYQKLYPDARFPDGHRYLARGLNNLASVLWDMGKPQEAMPIFEQALAVHRKVYSAAQYPDGHPNLATSLMNLGGILLASDRTADAAAHSLQALTMQQRLVQRDLLTSSEAAAFDRVAAEVHYLDFYLTTTRSTKDPAAAIYRTIWPSRAMVTRVLERRQANARAAAGGAGGMLDQLRGNRRRTEQLLQDTRLPRADRDALLATLADDREKLERDLIAAVPLLKRWQNLDPLGPGDLAKALPARAVFIDLISYRRFDYDPAKNGKFAERKIGHYAAFILSLNSDIERVELGAAAPIDAAIAEWRAAIDARRDGGAAATRLRNLVWAKLAPRLPVGTTTLYLAPDGDLARLPWAALPASESRVLLDDFALAIVPHGPFLLEQLKFPRPYTGAEPFLTLGGIDYASAKWSALPGTLTEVNALARLAPVAPTALTKSDATAARLKQLLPTMRYAHLATHGEFQADGLGAEK